MGREILFRGLQKWNECFIEGLYFMDANQKHLICTKSETRPNCKEIIIGTLGQFTGLTDKNGVKIFEGDYIKCTGGLRLEQYPDSGVVVYNQTGFSMKAMTCDGSPWHFSINFHDGTEIEVLGNIHEDPELLNQ